MDQLDFKSKEIVRPAFCVKVSQDEYARIKKMCDVTGETAPQLFRKALLHRKDLEQPIMSPEDTRELKVGLNRLGNNINQIAREINQGERAGWNESFNSFVRAVVELRHLFLGKYGNCKV